MFSLQVFLEYGFYFSLVFCFLFLYVTIRTLFLLYFSFFDLMFFWSLKFVIKIEEIRWKKKSWIVHRLLWLLKLMRLWNVDGEFIITHSFGSCISFIISIYKNGRRYCPRVQDFVYVFTIQKLNIFLFFSLQIRISRERDCFLDLIRVYECVGNTQIIDIQFHKCLTF